MGIWGGRSINKSGLLIVGEFCICVPAVFEYNMGSVSPKEHNWVLTNCAIVV